MGIDECCEVGTRSKHISSNLLDRVHIEESVL